MSRSVVNDAISDAAIGLPPEMREGIRRYFHGARRGNGGRTVPRDKMAERLKAWLEQRRAEEAGVIEWLLREEAR